MKPRSLLSIFFAIFAAIGLLGAAAIGVAAWVLDRSFTAMIENITADTGWLFADADYQGEPDADQERELRRAARDAEEEVEEEMEAGAEEEQ